ncbi:MAG: protein kinase domain-containing protein [Armatimonadota bacterium]
MADRPTEKINNDNPTTLVGGSAGTSADATRAVRSTDKPRAQAAPRFALGALAEGTMLCGSYKVVQTFRAHETGRPGVYLCDTTTERVVVKVYPLDYPPVAEVWAQIGQLNHLHVVPTIRQVMQDGLYCDVMPYHESGSLVEAYQEDETSTLQVPLEIITDRFAPQMLDALAYVHSMRLVHRDIKPSNILVDGDAEQPVFLLGDFDISSKLSTQLDQRITMRAAGTWTYTAPEAFPRYQDEEGVVGAKVTRAADYYSLGVTMLEMACGTTPLHTCSLPDVFDFYLSGQRISVPSELPERLRTLLQGLLIRQPQQRWGEAEVDRWLQDLNTPNDLQRIQDSQARPLTTKAEPPFRYRDEVVQNPEQLGQLIADDLDAAADMLRRADGLWTWLGRIDVNRAVAIRKRVQAASGGGAVVILACLLNPRAVCRIGPHELNTAQQWFDCLDSSRSSSVSDTELYRFLYWLYYHTDGDRALAKRIMPIVKTLDGIRLYEIRWAMYPETPLTVCQGYDARTPVQFASIAYGQESDWSSGRCDQYERAMSLWQDGIVEAWLRQSGQQQMAAISKAKRDANAGQPVAGFEEILRLMNPRLPRPEVSFKPPSMVKVDFKIPTRVRVPYTTTGPGNPVMNIEWQPHSGLEAAAAQYVERVGYVEAKLNAQDGQLEEKGRVGFAVESPNAKVTPGIQWLPYEVVNPNGSIVVQMIVSTILGGLIFGISRSIMAAMGYPRFFNIFGETVTPTQDGIMGQAGMLIFVTLLAAGVLVHCVVRDRVEKLRIQMGDFYEINSAPNPYASSYRTEALVGQFMARHPLISAAILIILGGPYSISVLDYITGSLATPHAPQIMWAMWGHVYGAVAGFWLISPLRGLTRLRIPVLAGVVLLMAVFALVIYGLCPPK